MTALAEQAACFQAFADPTRLRLLHLLREGERCVCDLVEALGEPQPKVSRHLAILRRAGLVTSRVEGPWRHYALPRRPEGVARTLLRCVATCLAGVPELEDDLARLRALPGRVDCGGAR